MESIFACSGPLAATLAEVSELAGYLSAGFCVFLTVGLLRYNLQHRGFGWLVLYGVLLLAHPAWTLSARSGDCGIPRLLASAFAVYLFIRLRQHQRRE